MALSSPRRLGECQVQPDVDPGMPEQVTRALVLLEKSLAVLPTYALAHVNAAMCHHCLFLRAGLKEENRTASLRHTEPGTKPLQISEQPTLNANQFRCKARRAANEAGLAPAALLGKAVSLSIAAWS
ncbi:MAG TPA: hypothetical protein VFI87_00720, partial [Hyphomicrobiaceae bacterium]|nr:hypothetical protein [Hyphomicrobiaceae bacterium]